ncbi:MAG: hypothetical protein AAF693_06295 [Bacteroidota bacterium]
MFDHSAFPKPLDEHQFQTWMEKGKLSKFNYHYLLIVWNELDNDYKPVYVEHRHEIDQYEKYEFSHDIESLVAAYNLFSGSKI